MAHGGPTNGHGGCAGSKWAGEEAENERFRDLADESLQGVFGVPNAGDWDYEANNHHVAYCERNPVDCSFIFKASDEATEEAKRRYKDNEYEQNAFRHAYWIALLTRNGIPIDKAMTFAAAHELDGDAEYRTRKGWGSDESRVDMHNNRIGAEVGASVKIDKRTPKPLRDPEYDRAVLAPLIKAALDDGRLDLTGT